MLSLIAIYTGFFQIAIDWIVASDVVGTEPDVEAIFTVGLPVGSPDMEDVLTDNIINNTLTVTAITNPAVEV